MSTGPFSFDTLPKVIQTILSDASENHELEQMLNELVSEDATKKESENLRNSVTTWFQETEKEASGAKSYVVASETILRRLPTLVTLYQRISTLCIDIVGADSMQIPEAGLWWYAEEASKKNGSEQQGALFQMFLFFGLSDLLCSIVSLGALGTDHSDVLKTPECGHEPFTALVLAQSYELIDRINVKSLGGSIFLKYVCATGFACKVLPDTQEVAEALACGYDGRKYPPPRDDENPDGLNPYMENGTPLHGFSSIQSRTTQESWAVCCAAHVVLQMGGSLFTPNNNMETPIQLVSTSDGIVFAYFMHAIAMQGIKDLTINGGGSGGGASSALQQRRGEESKEAATKAEVEVLRQELRATKQQFGNMLLLFGKILGLQQAGGDGAGRPRQRASKLSSKAKVGATRTPSGPKPTTTSRPRPGGAAARAKSREAPKQLEAEEESENSSDSAAEEEEEIMMA